MKNLIVANWKMNPDSQKKAEEIFNGIKNGASGAGAEVVVCPPFVYLSALRGLVLGAQNVFYKEGGAFTSGISAVMLKNLDVKYVIIGHSESRRYLKETDEIINIKIKEAIGAGLKVIFCVGETKEQRLAGEKNIVLEKQIKLGLQNIEDYSKLNIAYEPIWAIGTGDNCSVRETQESIDFVRSLVPANVRILYGGSVKSENSGDYIKKAGANGLLVGGASLDAEEFIKIIKSAD